MPYRSFFKFDTIFNSTNDLRLCELLFTPNQITHRHPREGGTTESGIYNRYRSSELANEQPHANAHH